MSTYVTLNDPLGTTTLAYDINDVGKIVGYYFDNNDVLHGFLDLNGSYTALNDPSAAPVAEKALLRTASTPRARSSGITRQQRRLSWLPLQQRHLHHAR